VAGAFVLGVAVTHVSVGPRRSALGAGFCGALTTFSTLQLELLDMLDDGHVLRACAYAAATIAAGLLAVRVARR
jgi:CrcB protein